MRLVSFVTRSGLVPDAKASALAEELDKAANQLDVLIQHVDQGALAEAFARELGVPVLALSRDTLEHAATDLLNRDVARRHEAIPVSFDGKKLVVAFANPLDTGAVSAIEFATRRKVSVAVATVDEVRAAIRFTYDFARELAAKMGDTAANDQIEVLQAPRDQQEIENLLMDPGGRSSAVRLVELIVMQGLGCGASDIHIEPAASSVSIRYRIDGVMETGVVVPKSLQSQLVGRIKVMASLDISERQKPQDGSISLRHEKRRVDVRVSVLPTPLGEKIVMRLLDIEARSLSLGKLDLGPEQLELVRREIHRPEGLILMSGPTGSGKTTTAHAILSEIATSPLNIVTIENPVEYRLKGVTQVEINERRGVTFAGTLRSILRQDPDVIFIGEIRDRETAEIALRAAQTGHLVISTVHTIDATSSTTRLLDLGIDPWVVAGTLRLVIAQRLLRRVCSACSAPYEPSEAERFRLGAWAAQLSSSFAGKGCGRCRNTGYASRSGAYEVLPISPGLRALLESRATETEMRAQARADGVRSMQSIAIEKIQTGSTTIAEVLRVIPLDVAEPTTQEQASAALAIEAAAQPAPPAAAAQVAPPAVATPAADSVAARTSPAVAALEGEHAEGASEEYAVLVVDDEVMNRSVIRHCLSKAALPIRVLLAKDASAALELLDTEKVHLALFDLVMPEMSGIELCQRVRSDPRHASMPIFMLSAVDELPEKTSAFEAGIDDYLTKPINGKELIARLTRAITRSYVKQPTAASAALPARRPPPAIR